MRTFRRFSVLVGVVLLAMVAGCRRGRVLAGEPSVGNGVRVVAVEPARLKGSSFSVSLVAHNQTEERIEVNRNQIAVVAPDGREFYRRGGRQIHWLPPRGEHPINLDVEIEPAAFGGARGLYLRFDGFYAGTVRVDIPPMALGEPTGRAGSTNTAFTAGGEGEASRERGASATDKAAGAFRRLLSGNSSEEKKTAPASDGGQVQQYRGPRKQLKQAGLKCAAMPLKTKDVSEQMAFIMDELLLTELQQSGFEAIGPDDINALIGFEKTKEAVGCDDMSCVAEIGNALGVDYLAAGNVAMLEGSVVLTLKLLDTKTPKVLARVNRVTEGGQKGLPRMIAEAVQELVDRSSL